MDYGQLCPNFFFTNLREIRGRARGPIPGRLRRDTPAAATSSARPQHRCAQFRSDRPAQRHRVAPHRTAQHRCSAQLLSAMAPGGPARLAAVLAVAATAVFTAVRGQEESLCNVISRAKWGGRPPKRVDYMTVPLKYAIIQHTASDKCRSMDECANRVRSIEAYHMNDLGWDDMGPSFLVGGDGNVYEGAGWLHVGAHTRGYNTRSVGIMLIGNFADSLPPQPQLEATKKLLECGEKEGLLAEDYKLLGHRQVSATQSPGLALFQEIQEWPAWSARP